MKSGKGSAIKKANQIAIIISHGAGKKEKPGAHKEPDGDEMCPTCHQPMAGAKKPAKGEPDGDEY